MLWATDDVRIDALHPLIPPAILIEDYPISEAGSELVATTRTAFARCLHGADDRLVVVVGPCSIHDVNAARDYAAHLKVESERLRNDLLLIMRVYFEKPRTIVGWKGLINDPDLDGRFRINKGLRLARGLLQDLSEMGVPAGCEFLDSIIPQFLADLVSWGSIGARTTESQVHRELASGMSCPMGFKNGTSGNVRIAVDAIDAAAHQHHFLSVTKQSVAAIVATRGNPDCHLILRGGEDGPNFDDGRIDEATSQLAERGLNARVLIDCSHGNSGKNPERQREVADCIATRIAAGATHTFGVMIESHLTGGSQCIEPGAAMVYGQSITDPCLSWAETKPLLDRLAAAVRKRRKRYEGYSRES